MQISMQRFFVSDFSSIFFGKYCLFRIFIGTICGIIQIPRFLRGGLLQVLMKQNQTYFDKKMSDISVIFATSYFQTMHILQHMLWDL